MINFKQKLSELSLNTKNSVIIGSGILNALNIRESHDMDIIVDEETFSRLKQNPIFEIIKPFGFDVLTYDVYEIGSCWNMVDINVIFSFKDLYENSVVIDSVRYNSLEFLLKVKNIWVNGKNPREKDIKDIEIIQQYMSLH